MTISLSHPCKHCGEIKPIAEFSLNRHGNPRPSCKPCRSSIEMERYEAKAGPLRAHREQVQQEKAAALLREKLEREARGARLQAERDRARRQHRERQVREQEVRSAAKARAKAARGERVSNRPARRTTEPCKPHQPQSSAIERALQLAELLASVDNGSRFIAEVEYEAAIAELRSVWLRSGDKLCVTCGRLVSPTKMLPPGRSNFYPQRCCKCAEIEYEANSRQVYGPLIGPRAPRLIPQRDGSRITVAELARRHRLREAGTPFVPTQQSDIQ